MIDKANDRMGQWLFPNYPESLLRLAGVKNIATCEAIKGELVAPRRTPDALLRVTFTDSPEATVFLIEIESVSSPDHDRQMFGDLLIFAAENHVLPEAILIVLKPRGNSKSTGEYGMASRSGSTRIAGKWKILELWTLQAEEVLAHNDVGIVPLVPFMKHSVTDLELLQECARMIRDRGEPDRIRQLLATTEISAGTAKLDPNAIKWFGEMQMWPLKLLRDMNSPMLDQFRDDAIREGREEGIQKGILEGRQEGAIENQHKTLVRILRRRFPAMDPQIESQIQKITDFGRLDSLLDFALDCPTVDAFQLQLTD